MGLALFILIPALKLKKKKTENRVKFYLLTGSCMC